MTSTRQHSVILVADVVGYSRLAEANEEAALAAVAWFRERAAAIVTGHGGRVFTRGSEGVTAVLPGVRGGVLAALELAETVRVRFAHSDRPALPARYGLHLGEVSYDKNGEPSGYDVSLTTRLEQIASPGEIVASRTMAEAAHDKAGIRLERVDTDRLRHLRAPVEVFRLAPDARPRVPLGPIAAALGVVALFGAGLVALTWPSLSGDRSVASASADAAPSRSVAAVDDLRRTADAEEEDPQASATLAAAVDAGAPPAAEASDAAGEPAADAAAAVEVAETEGGAAEGAPTDAPLAIAELADAAATDTDAEPTEAVASAADADAEVDGADDPDAAPVEIAALTPEAGADGGNEDGAADPDAAVAEIAALDAGANEDGAAAPDAALTEVAALAADVSEDGASEPDAAPVEIAALAPDAGGPADVASSETDAGTEIAALAADAVDASADAPDESEATAEIAALASSEEAAEEGAPGAAPSAEADAAVAVADADDGAASAPAAALAVMAFADLSPDAGQAHLAEGLSEELMSRLGRIEGLRVTGRTSAFAFRGRNASARDVGAALGVGYVLEGSVEKTDGGLRVAVHLASAESGERIWSGAYDRPLEEVFAVREEIARSVATELDLAIEEGDPSGASEPAADAEIYDLYLQARALYNRGGYADLERAAELYREVLARDPSFTPAHGGLAAAYAYMLIFLPTAETTLALERAVENALVRAPEEWSTHLASALLHMARHEWLDADASILRASMLAPSEPEVSVIRAWLLLQLGRIEDAAALLEATASLDPLSTRRAVLLQLALFQLGRDEEVEAEYQRAFAGRGREDVEHIALFRAWNTDDDALIENRFQTLIGSLTAPTPWIAAVRDAREDPAAALELIAAAHDAPESQDSARQLLIGVYAAHFGGEDLAIAALRRATIHMRSIVLNGLWYPDLAAVRRGPAFKLLVRDLGLVDYWLETGEWADFCREAGEDDFECF